ncbi:DUF2470 domain-containing protein [Kitasatospora viridis]|uniref:Uncharacterized protein DUF2470 n=1 Tax=Kitasatospora viridis TaxID=281105 RepID=A0A561S924_9ACTN|nr:DUF2470 domain-containing protein [Kitasatospora viridis]TWF71372.1 uncharacterized protein DUF2470 [Kitasatospora viridis]
MSVPTQPGEPTSAERVRTVLAAATSLTVTTEAGAVEYAVLHDVGAGGRLLLSDAPGGGLHGELAATRRQQLPATLEFTDIAATAVRDRVRAKVTLGGWLIPAEPGGSGRLGFDIALAALRADGQVQAVGLDDLLLAAPDPLATREADLLTHLADRHPEAVAALARLIEPRFLVGVTRIQPVRLDRHGMVLRTERARGQWDVRLLFRTPLEQAAEAGARIHELVASARVCHRRHWPAARP